MCSIRAEQCIHCEGILGVVTMHSCWVCNFRSSAAVLMTKSQLLELELLCMKS